MLYRFNTSLIAVEIEMNAQKEKAIKLIDEQIDSLKKLYGLAQSNKEFELWWATTKVIVANLFGEGSRHYKNFTAISYWTHRATVASKQNRIDKYASALNKAEAQLLAMRLELEIFSDQKASSQVAIDPIYLLQRIFSRLHIVARQLRDRHGKRSSLEINDEYDVQDLLHALLKLHFDDVRAEEHTPSYAGGSSRMDFLLKNEKIVIEVKKTNQSLGEKEVGDQLLIDIKRYHSHPDCQRLVCFVYDPAGIIGNPNGLEADLQQHDGKLEVLAMIYPK
jgi:hypothetical protein